MKKGSVSFKEWGIFFTVLLIAVIVLLLYGKPILTGFSVKEPYTYSINETSALEIKKLRLVSLCSPKPDIYRIWKIKNNNDLDIEYTWKVYKTEQTGSGIAESNGDSFFNTTTVDSSNKVEIFVDGRLHDSAKSISKKCVSEEPGPEEPEPELCIENWSCADWTECLNNSQTRECNDINVCNTTVEIPLLIQGCEEQNITKNSLSIFIESPENMSYENSTLLINISSEGEGMWFFNGTANETYSEPIYRTFGNGPNTLFAYTEDSLGRENSTSVVFIINPTEISETNETQTNQTNQSLPETPSQQSSSGGGGGGGGGSAPIIIYKNKTEETKTEVQETSEETSAELSEEAKTEEKARGFAALVGNAIAFFEGNGVDYRIGFGLIVLLVAAVAVLIARSLGAVRAKAKRD